MGRGQRGTSIERDPQAVDPREAVRLSSRTHYGVTARGEYGVRLMVALARSYGKGPQSLAELAHAEDLPAAFVEHLAADLRRAGLVISHRGAHGGYVLGRAPDQITAGEIMRVLEGPVAPMLCASEAPGEMYCTREDVCATKYLWLRVRDSIVRTLDTITLADLLGPATTEAPQPVHFVEDARQLHALLPERCLAPRTGPGAADSGLDRAERVALPISAIPSTELGDRREYGGPGDP